jgi:hypothetical protein
MKIFDIETIFSREKIAINKKMLIDYIFLFIGLEDPKFME